MNIRKTYVVVETVQEEAGHRLPRPVRRAAAVAVFSNPFAGRYMEDLSELIEASVPLGEQLSQMAVSALGCEPAAVESYGKAAIVGEAGELEHAAALLHPKLGKPLRDAVGGGTAIIPSAKKFGGPGTTIDVPLHYKNAAFVRSHFDAMEVRVPDGPRAGELILIVAVTDGGRPLPRVGGLTKEAAIGQDGLR